MFYFLDFFNSLYLTLSKFAICTGQFNVTCVVLEGSVYMWVFFFSLSCQRQKTSYMQVEKSQKPHVPTQPHLSFQTSVLHGVACHTYNSTVFHSVLHKIKLLDLQTKCKAGFIVKTAQTQTRSNMSLNSFIQFFRLF